MPCKFLMSASLAFAAGATSAAGVVGPMQRLDDTGMGQCVVGGVFSRDCSGTAQDGASGRDAKAHSSADGRAGFRFTRVCASGQEAGTGTCPALPTAGTLPDQWACTRDDVTGLLWELKTADGGVRDQHTLVSMANWGWGFVPVSTLLGELNGGAVCGATTWDTPTPVELQSLVDYSMGSNVKLDARFFPNTPWDYPYATPYPRLMPGEGNYIGLSFHTGATGVAYPGDGTYARMVVRPAALPTGARWVVSADGAQVTDRWTRLVWQRCQVGSAWDGARCTGKATQLTWQQALDTTAGQSTWRLPNVKELVSLQSLDDGLMDPVAFPGQVRGADVILWSSTPFWRSPDEAWEVDFEDGYAFFFYPAATTGTATVFLVRDHA